MDARFNKDEDEDCVGLGGCDVRWFIFGEPGVLTEGVGDTLLGESKRGVM